MPINARAKLVDKEGLTSSSMLFKFEMIEPEEMNFTPGQYILIDIGDGNQRNYSIFTSPLKSNKRFEILVDLSPQGKGSQYLEDLEINQEVKFIGETGAFILPEEISPNLVFVASGTGISPVRCIIDSIILNREDYDVNIFLYHSVKTAEQIIWPELFTEYLKNGHIDDYHVYVNDEETLPEYAETGETVKFISRLDQTKLQDMQFFLSGSGVMINDIQKALLQKGIQREVVYMEKHF